MKAVVLEKTRGRCVVLKENGDFSEIRDRGYAVGEQIVLKRALPSRALAACASLVMLFGLSGAGVSAVRTPVDFVYMDINPSLRLEINRFRRVIRIVPLNNDAQVLLSSHDIRQRDIADCMTEIVETCREDGYINENNLDIEVHVSTGSETVVRSVETAGTEFENGGLSVETFGLEAEDLTLAESMGVSAGWVRAAKRYAEEFGGTPEENAAVLRGVTKEEMYARVRAKKRASETPAAKKRAAAIAAYTGKFGGTEEENAGLLEKYTTKEIAAMCTESAAANPAKTPRPKKRATGSSSGKASASLQEQTAGTAVQSGTAGSDREETQPAATIDPGKAPSAGTQRSKEDRARERAVRRYTDRFGGTEEENALLLEGMTAEEILKLLEETPKPTHTPKPEREKANGNAARGVTRKEAVRRYTEVFGGTEEENALLLEGMTAEEILKLLEETPKPAHTPKPEREKANGNAARGVTRKEAVRRYTDRFGGTEEENNRLLKGLSVKDILQYIQSGTPYGPLP